MDTTYDSLIDEQWAELRRLVAAGYSAEAAECAQSLAEQAVTRSSLID